jgi:hypothetical protein
LKTVLKNDMRSFFKFEKRNSSGYPSSMFFESQSARGPEEAVNLFAEFFQDVYVSEAEPTLNSWPDEEHDSHKVSLVQLTQL